jgi:cystathionine gamma-lyase
VGGAVLTSDEGLAERLRFLQNAVGAVPSPLDSFLVLRGLKTLHVRMERHQENAARVARFLEGHPQVERVTWPGLASHPQHALARRQMRGFGGMLTFVIRGGLPAARAFLSSLRVFTLAESLGGVESLIEHPAIMTHASVPAEVRARLGIDDGLVRVSVGIEHADDLLEDLERGFAAAHAGAQAR